MKIKLKLRYFVFAGLIFFNQQLNANPVACMAIICLSNVPGAVPAECRAARQTYFIIQCCYSYFEPVTTATLRDQYLRTCPFDKSPVQSVEPTLKTIRLKYGGLLTDPQK